MKVQPYNLGRIQADEGLIHFIDSLLMLSVFNGNDLSDDFPTIGVFCA